MILGASIGSRPLFEGTTKIFTYYSTNICSACFQIGISNLKFQKPNSIVVYLEEPALRVHPSWFCLTKHSITVLMGVVSQLFKQSLISPRPAPR